MFRSIRSMRRPVGWLVRIAYQWRTVMKVSLSLPRDVVHQLLWLHLRCYSQLVVVSWSSCLPCVWRSIRPPECNHISTSTPWTCVVWLLRLLSISNAYARLVSISKGYICLLNISKGYAFLLHMSMVYAYKLIDSISEFTYMYYLMLLV
jgi:hypothetical protein